MRKYLLAGAAALVIAAPAAARDNSPYLGIEGGVLFPRNTDVDAKVQTFTGVTVDSVGNAFTLHQKTGVDLDAIGGYDFGMFRLEGEVAWKRSSLDRVDNFDPALLTAISTATGVPVTLPLVSSAEP
jgi:hypothetical protein